MYKSTDGFFRDLDDSEEKEFRQWAHENYGPGTEIKSVWHPVIQEECRKINALQVPK
jgi:hypothetical protein